MLFYYTVSVGTTTVIQLIFVDHENLLDTLCYSSVTLTMVVALYLANGPQLICG